MDMSEQERVLVDEFPTEVMEPHHYEPHHVEPEGPRRSRLMIFMVVVVILLACAVTGLGVALMMGRDADEAAEETTLTTIPPTTLDQSGAGTPSPGGRDDEGDDTGTTPEPEVEEPGGVDEPAAPCTASAISATVGGSIDGHPVNVTDITCTSSGAYAWALLTPTEAGLDPVYAYFRDVGGGWETLDYGTAISCTGAGIPVGECAELP